MKVSDYVASFLVQNGIKDIFLLSGGGMMHLLDSVSRNESLNIYCNLNEQATSICADSYAQYTNKLSAFIVTTGPGATNAVTGVAASWLDSTPVLAISGQTKTKDMGAIRGLRQFGAQEIAIIPMVKSITKYAVTVMEANEIAYHLEKAAYLAVHGRRGPVWIDIPLDIQGAQVSENLLKHFDPYIEGHAEKCELESYQISEVHSLINDSKRPVFLIGHGIVADGKADAFKKLAKTLNIPVLSTWRVRGLFDDNDELFYGHPGIPATRYSNFILQKCDLIIIIGTRLNPALTAYDEGHFAFQAKKIIIDIDEAEIEKLDMKFDIKIVCNSAAFVDKMLEEISLNIYDNCYSEWIHLCLYLREKYSLYTEKQSVNQDKFVNPYLLAMKISDNMKKDDIFIGSSSGRTCGISHMAIKLKENQKFISSMGLGSMGFTIPSSIACCIAGNRHRVIAFEGDGSLQHNVQELQLIKTYDLPLKLFILSNEGYASIYMMQKNNFASKFVGCISENGVGLPSIKRIADLYNINYMLIDNDESIDTVVDKVFSDDCAYICEVKSSIFFDEIPKSMTVVNSDGTFSSSNLENLYPFLPEEEINEVMSR